MKQVLAVYGTAYGQTEKIIRRIADRLIEQGIHVLVVKGDAVPDPPGLTGYDAILVGASILGGKHQRYIEDFARKHADQLNRMPSAFVSVSGAAGSPLPAEQERALGYLRKFFEATGWQPRKSARFGGCMAYTRYGFFLRWLTWMISKKRGGPTDRSRDHETTDWNAVDQFAAELRKIIERISPAPVAAS